VVESRADGVSPLHFYHIVWRSFALAGGADAEEAGAIA
tara:strand:+ start:612 stop:725 length:114 start_codon:yes stop_codon:yes gene_type:complete